jgi:hypothetical protein
LQLLWLPYSISPSSIAEGDFVVCRINSGLNIGVIVESESSLSPQSPALFTKTTPFHFSDEIEDAEVEDDPCGEIVELATCEQMEAFQTKLKNEFYLLETCQDYLSEMEELAKEIQVIDVEFQMDGSLIVYYISISKRSESYHLSLIIIPSLFLFFLKTFVAQTLTLSRLRFEIIFI